MEDRERLTPGEGLLTPPGAQPQVSQAGSGLGFGFASTQSTDYGLAPDAYVARKGRRYGQVSGAGDPD
ncbi:MAG: hypothetical protein NUW24_05165 [Anaerolineae bacterium]|nr:hypothetical protein [Anaerolineae bacterium]MDH7473014.1 hypothetical protein [Anaerolineae bacterium]